MNSRIKNLTLCILAAVMLAGASAPVLAASASDNTYYDLRPRLPKVRDQAEFGICWAFGITAAMESNLIQKGLASPEIDLSEYYLAYYTFNDESPALYSFESPTKSGFDTSANEWQSTGIIVRGTGPVLESRAPYPKSKKSAKIPAAAPRDYKLKNILYMGESESINPPIKGDRIATVKALLMKYGAVSVSLYVPDPKNDNEGAIEAYMSKANGYYSGFVSEGAEGSSKVRDPNHIVAVVGWDDKFSRDKFGGGLHKELKPRSDGAWIVRNSWGEDFGDKGYFYVSYEEGTLTDGIAYDMVPAEPDETIYQYNKLGVADFMNGDWIPVQEKDVKKTAAAWCANMYTAKRTENIVAAAFYTVARNTVCEVSVYTGCNAGAPTSGKKSVSYKTTIEAPGYCTIDLPSPASVSEGEKFSVVIKVTSPNYAFPIPVGCRLPDVRLYDKSRANPGESFISATGKYWTDTTDISPTANVCIKAFGKK